VLSKADKEEIKRLLQNWLLWTQGGRGGSISPFPAYNLSPPGRRSAAVMPVLILDAEDVDVVLRDMPGYWRRILVDAYFASGGAEVLARRLKVSRATYWRRVDEAHGVFWGRWVTRREHAQRLHDTKVQASAELVGSPVEESA
jgi:hypothetical protein